jgi:hypothetical protein
MAKEHPGAEAAKAEIARTRATERMRRSRNRRRMGIRCYTLQLRESEIAALVRRGLCDLMSKPIVSPSSMRCMRSSTTPFGSQGDTQHVASDASPPCAEARRSHVVRSEVLRSQR